MEFTGILKKKLCQTGTKLKVTVAGVKAITLAGDFKVTHTQIVRASGVRFKERPSVLSSDCIH